MTAVPLSAAGLLPRLGLSRHPFPPTPDAQSYFFTPRLEEDYAELLHCIVARKGIMLLTGEVGLGKSTLVRRLLDSLAGRRYHSALVFNTFLQGEALLAAILADFGLPPAGSPQQGLEQLNRFLIERHRAGDTCLLVIDDAQNLSIESLELVRLLCNLETGQEKLLQILLAGQPELEQTLASEPLRQLNSRIVKHARLGGLCRQEMGRYFDFRINACGGEGRYTLAPAAVAPLWRVSRGNLRRMHLVLDRCLYGLASRSETVVRAALLRRAVAELPELRGDAVSAARGGARRRRSWALAGALAATVTMATAAASLWPWSAPTLSALARLPSPQAKRLPAPEADPPAPSMAPAAAAGPVEMPARQACRARLQAQATPGEVVLERPLPRQAAAHPLTPGARICTFTEHGQPWVAWAAQDGATRITQARETTRAIQARLQRLGLLEAQAGAPTGAQAEAPIDGLFGPRTSQALARFQQQQGLPVTGLPDNLTFLFLESPHASAR